MHEHTSVQDNMDIYYIRFVGLIKNKEASQDYVYDVEEGGRKGVMIDKH